jgi:hypothetical protein
MIRAHRSCRVDIIDVEVLCGQSVSGRQVGYRVLRNREWKYSGEKARESLEVEIGNITKLGFLVDNNRPLSMYRLCRNNFVGESHFLDTSSRLARPQRLAPRNRVPTGKPPPCMSEAVQFPARCSSPHQLDHDLLFSLTSALIPYV